MGFVCKLIKNYKVGDFAIGATCERSREEHMLKVQTTQVLRGILRVDRNLANLWLNLRDEQPAVYICFPHLFTHTYEIVRRVSEEKP